MRNTVDKNRDWTLSFAMGVSLLLMGLFVALQGVLLVVILLLAPVVEQMGLMIAVGMMFIAFVMLWAAIWAGGSRGLLRLNRPTAWQGLIGFAVLTGFWVLSAFVGELTTESPMDFMEELIDRESMVSVFVLCIVVVVIAPIYEELVFRGVIFGLIAQSSKVPSKSQSKTTQSKTKSTFQTAQTKRVALAVAVSSLLFTLVHGQYGVFGLLMIFVLSLIFVWARICTGSLWLPIALHIANNAVAMGVFLWD